MFATFCDEFLLEICHDTGRNTTSKLEMHDTHKKERNAKKCKLHVRSLGKCRHFPLYTVVSVPTHTSTHPYQYTPPPFSSTPFRLQSDPGSRDAGDGNGQRQAVWHSPGNFLPGPHRLVPSGVGEGGGPGPSCCGSCVARSLLHCFI